MIELMKDLPSPFRVHYQWQAGDRLTHLDHRPVQDILDLYFYQPDHGEAVRLTVRRRDGRNIAFRLPLAALEALTGALAPMQFRRCACRCIFCFIDQNPPAMRSSIYVKDEDYRFSFLYGNYVTLTSLGERGLKRIIEQRLSPLYVSVHCTDNALRTRMLGLKRSADICRLLDELASHGIELHTQIVLCPGWNDGPHLERSFRDLFALRRPVQSAGGVASLVVVPVGLTVHREGLIRLEPVTRECAASVIDQVAPWQAEARRIWGEPFIYLSDEFYLLAARPFPAEDHYGGFPQIDNGAGLTRRLESLWSREMKRAHRERRMPRRPLTILTGILAVKAFERVLLPEIVRAGAPLPELVPIRNAFYGPRVTVAGLLTGGDLRRALLDLPDAPLRTVCISPRVFNSDGLTLDGMSLAELAAGQPHEIHAPDEEGFIDWWIELDGS